MKLISCEGKAVRRIFDISVQFHTKQLKILTSVVKLKRLQKLKLAVNRITPRLDILLDVFDSEKDCVFVHKPLPLIGWLHFNYRFHIVRDFGIGA